MSLDVDEWKKMLIETLRSGRASTALLAWVADAALAQYEAPEYTPDEVEAELDILETEYKANNPCA